MNKRPAESQRGPDVFEALGITAAKDGDPAGVARFLRWVETQVTDLGIFGCQPETVSNRLCDLARQIKGLSEFAEGYAQAMKDKPTPASKTQNPRTVSGRALL